MLNCVKIESISPVNFDMRQGGLTIFAAFYREWNLKGVACSAAVVPSLLLLDRNEFEKKLFS